MYHHLKSLTEKSNILHDSQYGFREKRSSEHAILDIINEIRIKRDFLRHKTVKTNDKIRRFRVVMTPLSRKNVFDLQITAFKAMWREN